MAVGTDWRTKNIPQKFDPHKSIRVVIGKGDSRLIAAV